MRSAAERQEETERLRKWVYGTMRQDKLRDTSDRGRSLLEFEITPATDRVDREHVPAHLQDTIENAINDQYRVSVLNFYLQVTGREPRTADELGWNRTRDEPSLLDNDEVGYGYALASQHQHHCANTLADAIDLGKDNINDFYMIHIIHCLSLVKTYSEKLDFYREPVLPLTDQARGRLESGFQMSDWEDEDGNIIKHGMLLRNPELSVVIENLRAASDERSRNLQRWIIILIAEASVASLILTVMGARWLLFSTRQTIPNCSSIRAKSIAVESSDFEKESLVSEDSAWAH